MIFLIGITLISFGITLTLELRPLTKISSFIWHFLRWFANLMPAHISGPLILLAGAGFIMASIYWVLKTTIDATVSESSSMSDKTPSQSIFKSLEKARRKGRGPKIVAIGGGTGLSTLLRGIKHYSTNITAIVTVGDDGGSSGRLREELKVVPPGDIRNCIVALADEEEVTTSLFQYRFQDGSLKGHSLGNLFLAALCNICDGDMAKATQVASRILRSGGQVLPSSLQAIHLCAELADGTIIQGESKIPEAAAQKINEQRIKRIFCESLPEPLTESLEVIKEADLIILGPGSLYTSIIPNLLFPSIITAIKESKAKVLYVCNLVQDRETKNYSAIDFIKAIHQHSDPLLVDALLINDPESWNLEKGKPVQIDLDQISALGIEVIVRPKLQDENGRHSPIRLARSILQWFNSKHPNREAISQTAALLATVNAKANGG
ncbi:MAG: uridine diphosphate-N-acetylglucosamine-binding protein YvcK [Candidatus Melainabacteria bacterium]